MYLKALLMLVSFYASDEKPGNHAVIRCRSHNHTAGYRYNKCLILMERKPMEVHIHSINTLTHIHKNRKTKIGREREINRQRD